MRGGGGQHLVWSVLGISTAIKTALKVALYDCFDSPLAPLTKAKVDHHNRTKNEFFDGAKCKICFPNHRFNFPTKTGVTNLFAK